MGEILRRLRYEHGFTQEELSMELNISQQSISKWEQDISQPSFGTIVKLSTLYKISIDEFKIR
ncbi:helix-turn-helix domain-containing protein [Periweissella cryptocerci]|nr:helix-turn-helix transcriptional regulator [Periweissella cryptocerci]